MFFRILSLVTRVLELFAAHSVIFIHLKTRAFVCHWIIDCAYKFESIY